MSKKFVIVFEDPITRQKPEGVALLIAEYGGYDEFGNKQCSVQFFNKEYPDEELVVMRQVHMNQLGPQWVIECDKTCNHPDDNWTFFQDGMCTCGVVKHHYHCNVCKGVVQVG
jgi:hypothetical protein